MGELHDRAFTYTGEFNEDSVFHGQGHCVDVDSSGRISSYTGAYEHGVYCGPGVYRWPSGASYTGMFRYGSAHGRGIKRFGNCNRNTLDGLWFDDKCGSFNVTISFCFLFLSLSLIRSLIHSEISEFFYNSQHNVGIRLHLTFSTTL